MEHQVRDQGGVGVLATVDGKRALAGAGVALVSFYDK